MPSDVGREVNYFQGNGTVVLYYVIHITISFSFIERFLTVSISNGAPLEDFSEASADTKFQI